MSYPDAMRALTYVTASRRTKAVVASALERLPPDLRPEDPELTLTPLRVALSRALDQMVLPVVAHEIHAARTRGRLAGRTPEERYRSFFVDAHALTPEAEALPGKYPRLFSGIDTVAATTGENIKRCLERLVADREALTGFYGRPLGRVEHVDPAGSDRHGGGGQVVFVNFDGGTRLVYKPRSLQPDEAFGRFLRLLDLPDGLNLRLARPLPRDGYGWVEFVPFRPLASPADAHRYYRRAGALLAVCDVVGFSDGHFENLVACGSHPVLVDCETLFQSQREPDDYQPGEERSVLATGLVQRLGDEGRGRGLMAALQVAGPLRNHYLFPHAVGERTDKLQVRFQGSLTDACVNFPVANGCFESPLDHEDALIAGMSETYAHVMACRPRLLGADGFWQSIKRIRVRQVMRATMYYLLLLRRLEQPEPAASTAAADLELERGLRARDAHPVNALVDYEKRDLLRCDIPVFSSRPGSRDLVSGDGDRYPRFFRSTALTQIRHRIASLDEAYSHRQGEIVRYHLPLAPRRHPLPDGAAELMRAHGAEL